MAGNGRSPTAPAAATPLPGRGGGIWGGMVTMFTSTVSGNFAGFGGGVQANDVTLSGSTVSGNFAGAGGGLWVSTATLSNSSVSGNTATTTDGGGIFARDVV